MEVYRLILNGSQLLFIPAIINVLNWYLRVTDQKGHPQQNKLEIVCETYVTRDSVTIGLEFYRLKLNVIMDSIEHRVVLIQGVHSVLNDIQYFYYYYIFANKVNI